MMPKHTKKALLVLIGLLLFLIVAFAIAKAFGVSMNREKEFAPERGNVGTQAMQEMQAKLESELCVNGRYPAYYAGAYPQNYNLVVLLTVDSKTRRKEITDFLGREDGVVFRQVEYSWNELMEAQEKFAERFDVTIQEGNEDLKAFLDSTSGGIDVQKNRVIVRIWQYSKRKVRKMKELFGDYEIIQYEEGGKNSF